MLMVLDFLGKCVCEPGESAHLHAHGQILPLNITAYANHASKRVARLRTAWWSYFRFRLITRKQLGINGDEWP